jgi:hypothetical protein
MTRLPRVLVPTVAFALIAAVCLAFMPVTDQNAACAAQPEPSDPGPQPVEDDMHEFMEYVFQPTYKRLKADMAAAPDDESAWKGIKSNALILAEGGNLLLIRTPEKEANAWQSHAVDVRELGGKLYRTAKTKDYDEARTIYVSLLNKCNSCHDKFAHGEHQLKP